MLKNISSLLSRLVFLAVVLFGSLFFTCEAQAEDTVILRASVVERKATDTLNDFDFSSVNTISSEKSNSADVKASSEEGVSSDQKSLFGRLISGVANFFKSIFHF